MVFVLLVRDRDYGAAIEYLEKRFDGALMSGRITTKLKNTVEESL